jgi:hypothetical protein
VIAHLLQAPVVRQNGSVGGQGYLTMEEIIFSLKHYWRFVDAEALALQELY